MRRAVSIVIIYVASSGPNYSSWMTLLSKGEGGCGRYLPTA